jgi:hypothetical protein
MTLAADPALPRVSGGDSAAGCFDKAASGSEGSAWGSDATGRAGGAAGEAGGEVAPWRSPHPPTPPITINQHAAKTVARACRRPRRSPLAMRSC